MQRGGGGRACNQSRRGAGKRKVYRQEAGGFDYGLDSRVQEFCVERVIEKLGRHTDRARMVPGVLIVVQLVQHQAELADDQRNDK